MDRCALVTSTRQQTPSHPGRFARDRCGGPCRLTRSGSIAGSGASGAACMSLRTDMSPSSSAGIVSEPGAWWSAVGKLLADPDLANEVGEAELGQPPADQG